VLGGVRDALPELAGDLLDGPFALREQVDDFGAVAVAKRLRDGGEPVEQRILSCTVTHRALTVPSELFKRTLDDHTPDGGAFKRFLEQNEVLTMGTLSALAVRELDPYAFLAVTIERMARAVPSLGYV